jgi:hypothetical protein
MNYLSLWFFLWLSSGSLQLWLVMQATRRRLYKTHPWCFWYFGFQFMAVVIGQVVYFGLGGSAYFWTFYALTICGNILALLVAGEAGRKIFGPRLALPSWVPVRVVSTGTWLLAVVFAANLTLRVSHGGPWTHLMITMEQWTTGALFVVFAVIVFFRFNLDISREQKKATGISIGFVLYLSIAMAAVLVRASGSVLAGVIAAKVSAVSYFMVLGWWGYVLQLKERTAVKATPEQRQGVLLQFREVQSMAAGLGIASKR